jgi:hypothetical protein
MLASAISSLPATAALLTAGALGLWAAILATTIRTDLLVTGSVAKLISSGSPVTPGPGSAPGSSPRSGWP